MQKCLYAITRYGFIASILFLPQQILWSTHEEATSEKSTELTINTDLFISSLSSDARRQLLMALRPPVSVQETQTHGCPCINCGDIQCPICLDAVCQLEEEAELFPCHGKNIHKKCAEQVLASGQEVCPCCRLVSPIHRPKALFKAVLKEDFVEAKRLVEAGLNLNEMIDGHATALHQAVYSGQMNIVELLLNAQADMNLCDEDGDTPLHLAAQQKRKDIAVLLMDRGAHRLAKNRQGKIPAACCANSEMTTLFDSWIPACENKSQCLLEAAAAKDISLVKKLLEVGVDNVNFPRESGSTALHFMVASGVASVVKTLIAAGAQVNIQGTNGNTPLHYACNRGYKEIAQLLLNAGADKTKKNKEGLTPVDLALKSNHSAIKELFKSSSPEISIEQLFACASGNEKLLTAAIDLHKMFFEKHQTETNAEMKALFQKKGQKLLVKSIMSNYAQGISDLVPTGVSLTSFDDHGNLPLHLAALGGAHETIKELIKHECDINALNTNGLTPLMMAICASAKKQTIELLLSLKANPNVINEKSNNMTALHFSALEENSPEIIALLLSYGADKTIKNILGDTPYDIAREKRNSDLMTLLMK